MNKIPLFIWLETQPKEFVDEIFNNRLLGDGQFTIEKLRELDDYFNPEEIDNE